MPVDDERPAPVPMSRKTLMGGLRGSVPCAGEITPVGILPTCRYGPRHPGADGIAALSAKACRRGMSSSRDIERYADLFASRTKVMKSSAMRDLMAVTARPEVISLAGGLPDTSTFPPDTFAAVAQRIAAESCAKALQYGP